MNKYLISIITVLTVLAISPITFAKDEETSGQRVLIQRENMRQIMRDMSEEEREKFLAEMQKRREEFMNMSDEKKEEFRAEMIQRFGGRVRTSREEQLKAIIEIEVSDRNEKDGYWESRKVLPDSSDITWADLPPVKVNSKIFSPVNYMKAKKSKTIVVSGVAFAGTDPVEKVEVGIAKIKKRPKD